ncbi:hypothetical protein AXF42_Ash021351 [Apostasia shenzhenica]|uniref:Uncharacterized protein n=1 Tax=Apostasia shenzhenica TaxID=1088818 RepID=A0A2H9ZSN5_9ASPA|nr:hypothetical protein AXF42_Ash021351 [Apostasia shenzhenica]
MEQCLAREVGKNGSVNFGKRIGSEGWARGSQFRTHRLSANCLSCCRGESGSPRAGWGTDWERPSGDFPASKNRLRTGTDKGNPTV